MKTDKTRQELFNEFVKKNTEQDKYLDEIVTVGNKTFLIKKNKNFSWGGYWDFIDKVKLYSNLFGITDVYESSNCSDYQDIVNETISVTSSGATSFNYTYDG